MTRRGVRARIGSRTGLAALAAAAVLVAGCDTWFGESEDPPLPGERISVMVSESDTKPDPRLADLPVELPEPYVNESWPQAGGYPDHAMHHLAAREALAERWSADIGAGSEGDQRVLGAPVVAGGRVFTMDRDYDIRAFDADTGERQWTFDAEVPEEDAEAFGGGLAYADGTIVATTGYAEVVAVDAASGEQVWRHRLSGPVRAAPSIASGRVITVTVDNQTTALELATGAEVWRHAGFAEVAGLLGGASPAVAETSVLVPYSSGELFALRLGNGSVSWSENLVSSRRVDALSSLADIRGRPVIDRGKAFAVSHAGRMLSIDMRTGQRVWDRRIAGVESPWVAGDFIYQITTDQVLLCLTREGGRVRWATQLPAYEDMEDRDDPITWTGPVLVGDRLLVAGTTGELWSVSPYTGEPMGEVDVGDGVRVAPVVADGAVYVQTDGGTLIAYR